jgi:hypothetical protein
MMVLLFVVTFTNWVLLQDLRRENTLLNEATHLLEGRIVKNIPGHWSSTIYIYVAKSPTTGANIAGKFRIDHSSPRNGDFQQGTMVAILYRDDKLYRML